MNQTEKSTVHDLEYARSAPVAWVSRHRKRLLLAALFLAVAIPLYQFRQPIRRWAEWQYWFRQCLNHRVPATIELSISDPQAMATVQSHPDYIVPSQGTPFSSAVYYPRVLRELGLRDMRVGTLSALTPTGVLFLGKMNRIDGEERLVFILGSTTNALNLMSDIDLVVLPVPDLLEGPPRQAGWFAKASSGRYIPAILAPARLDPKDPSRLTFRFQLTSRPDGPSGAVGTLQGVLQNDDTINLKLLSIEGDGKDNVHLHREKISNLLKPVSF